MPQKEPTSRSLPLRQAVAFTEDYDWGRRTEVPICTTSVHTSIKEGGLGIRRRIVGMNDCGMNMISRD
ncbi:hypothetical protein VNO80_33959 [Phaseolus coccineus]|uniref:Uncharacterized protein n=1 Tax=Phaseolus coccineus TaxID=3886 RepID=A0AAN9L0R7_PHACN